MANLNADVLLLAAGYGKRLGELTEDTPKPLLPLRGKPIIDWNLEMIARSGARRVFINLFYLGEQIEAHVGDGSKWGLQVEYSKETELLDTGGAIKNIESCLRHDTLLTVNSDILLGEDFSLAPVLSAHQEHPKNPVVTLVLREDKEAKKYGAVGIDKNGQVVSFLGNSYFPGEVSCELMYLGVQAISRRGFDVMPAAGSVFSITQDTHVKLLRGGAYFHSTLYSGLWSDLGTPERLSLASVSENLKDFEN